MTPVFHFRIPSKCEFNTFTSHALAYRLGLLFQVGLFSFWTVSSCFLSFMSFHNYSDSNQWGESENLYCLAEWDRLMIFKGTWATPYPDFSVSACLGETNPLNNQQSFWFVFALYCKVAKGSRSQISSTCHSLFLDPLLLAYIYPDNLNSQFSSV